jgi:hypothetical protein
VAAEIRAGDFPARPGFRCRACDYRSLCPAQEAGRGATATAEGEAHPVARARKNGRPKKKKATAATPK